MLYHFLRFWVRLALRVFYKKIQVRNAHFLKTPSPLIVVSNHPNTLMDPLIVAALFPQPLFFLANASLFRGKWKKKLFAILGLIPIYRKQDVRNAGEKPDNKAIFAKCYEYLGKGASILIFSEGTSFVERRLREIKTGTARMALGAEAEHNFNLGLSIVSLGINYSHPTNFRSEVFVSIGEPIHAKDFAELFGQKEGEAVDKLTEKIRQTLENNMIITKDHEEDVIVSQLEHIYQPYVAQQLGLSERNLEEKFDLIRKLIEALQFFEENENAKIQILKEKLKEYTTDLEKSGLRDNLLGNSQKPNAFSLIFWAFSLFLGFPFFLYGFVNNYIPYKLPFQIAKRLTSDIEFWAAIMMLSGLVLFLIFYFFQIGLFYYFAEPLSTFLYALSLPISGFFALFYAEKAQNWFDHNRLRKEWANKPDFVQNLARIRQEILDELEDFRKKA